ncbi:MAG TPA: hypothetical protein VJT77_08570 [Burkholderiales bacterium]|nr:hypothetical protein [Burkholderiales bacterium]
MFRHTWCAMALAVAVVPAYAQDPELAKMREALRQLQQQVQQLEKRLQEAEGKGAPGTPSRSQPQSNAFNPDISLILQGTAARSSREPGSYAISGFAPSGGEVAPAARGFNLGESELVIASNVDPYFRGQLVAAFTPENEVEVEEAFFQTLALGRGFTLKGGRFLSGIGYQNEIHQHAWDFQDAPLAYKAFLGGRLNDDGVQLRWIAPTDLFLELGAELGRGRGFPATDRNRNGANASSLFGHLGGDVGASTAWRAGLSYLRASAQDRAFTDLDALGAETTQSLTGRSRLWIADFVLKWSPNGNAAATNFKLQGEYFRRRESGTLTFADTAQTLSDAYASRQSGWYTQAVYQFMPRWRVGYRYDRLDHGTVDNAIVANGLGPSAADFPLLMTAYNPTRNTVMVDWSPTEFSRLRLQFASDRSRVAVTDRQLLLQYIHSLGAHGAHTF